MMLSLLYKKKVCTLPPGLQYSNYFKGMLAMFRMLKKISTKPHYESHTWGDQSSIVSKFIYYILYLLRYLSLLQFLKLLFRSFSKNRNKSKSKDRLDSKSRLDFHARYTEIYLIFVLSLSVFIYNAQKFLASDHHIFIVLISLLFLVESIIWVVYYMLFRILMEKKLTIYDEAEYLIMLPVVITSQLFFISIIFPDLTPIEILSLMFNVGNAVQNKPDVPEIIPSLVGIAGLFYITIIIASLIKIVPPIPVWRRPNITIIGSGDVVSQRILPTLLKLYSPKQISVASDYIDHNFRSKLKKEKIDFLTVKEGQQNGFYTHEEREKIKKNIVNYVISRSSYAIIATPSDEHFPYIIALANEGIRFAVEKPVCVAIPHLDSLASSSSELMNTGFLFSYYWLEKALPLNYFLSLNPVYRDLLKIKTSNQTLDTPSSFSFEKRNLGKPNLIVIEFLEGDESEDRYWTELPETGGMVAETLIHSMSLVNNILGFHEKIEVIKSFWLRNDERHQNILRKHCKNIGPTYVDILAKIDQCDVRIRVGKYTDYKKRTMHVIFDNGKITCDFDDQVCNVYKKDNTNCIEIELKHKGRYETQLLLFHEFMLRGWRGLRFDDFPSQLQTIRNCFDVLPCQSNIINIRRDSLNNWLHENLLFVNGIMMINRNSISERLGPNT